MEHATGNFRWTRTIVMGKVVRVPRIPSKWNFSSFRSASSVFHRFCSSPFLLWILASPCNFNPYNFIPLPLSVIFIVARRTVHFSIVVSWKKTFHPFSHLFSISYPYLLSNSCSLSLSLSSKWKLHQEIAHVCFLSKTPVKTYPSIKTFSLQFIVQSSQYICPEKCVSKSGHWIRNWRKNTFAKKTHPAEWRKHIVQVNKRSVGRWLAI